MAKILPNGLLHTLNYHETKSDRKIYVLGSASPHFPAVKLLKIKYLYILIKNYIQDLENLVMVHHNNLLNRIFRPPIRNYCDKDLSYSKSI